MLARKAYVKDGQLIFSVPTDLPEGTEIDLSDYEGGDDLDEEERAALDASIEEGLMQLTAGQGIDASVVMAKLRAR